MYAFLSGGTGTPKLLEGFRNHLNDVNLQVICNTGDDYQWNGLHISPDLDTVLYLFSGKLDVEKYWGIKQDTFHALQTLNELEGNQWFNVGDFDLGLHIFRTNLLKINTLTEITKMICNQWQISATILPMADQLITTLLDTQHGKLHFQEYFVRHRHSIDVHKIIFQGDKTQSTKDVLMAISNAKQIIIGPSNPVTSIGPIISINDVNQQLKDTSHKVTLISPIEGNRAFSGPTVQLMLAHGISPDIIGICNYYQNLISKIIISPKDKHLSSKIYDLGIEPMIMDIELKNDQNKSQLAREILDVL